MSSFEVAGATGRQARRPSQRRTRRAGRGRCRTSASEAVTRRPRRVRRAASGRRPGSVGRAVMAGAARSRRGAAAWVEDCPCHHAHPTPPRPGQSIQTTDSPRRPGGRWRSDLPTHRRTDASVTLRGCSRTGAEDLAATCASARVPQLTRIMRLGRDGLLLLSDPSVVTSERREPQTSPGPVDAEPGGQRPGRVGLLRGRA